MEGHAHDLGLWGLAHPGNEPVYCDGPSPLHTDAIIYTGSDDEADEATRLARIQRYEEYGRRFLQGRPLRILSASLRGPFDKATGWRNPWLPSIPSDYVPRHEHLSRQSVPALVAPDDSSIQPHDLSNEGGGMMEDGDAQDSMECHLPSPQSHENLQFCDSPSKLERRSRIESWANGVDGDILEKDRFWAPDYFSVDRDAELSQKRPAGKDWLKRRPAKKRRLPVSQSTGVTFNSTPTPMTQSGSKSSIASVVRNRSANRSFEMTTPSSSPGKGARESQDPVEHQAAGPSDEYRQLSSVNASATDTRTRAEPAITSIQEKEEQGREGEGDADGYEQEIEPDAKRADLIADDDKGLSRKRPSYDNIESEETSFEDCADDSFHYRARQLKQSTPTRESNENVVNDPSENIVTGISVSPEPFDITTSSFGIDNQGSCHNIQHDQFDAGGTESIVQLNDNPDPVAYESHPPTSSALTSNESLVQFHQTMFKTCRASTAIINAASVPNVDNDRALNDISSNERGSRLNIRTQIPHTLLEVKEASAISPGPFLDEGVTLVGDVVDMEGSGDLEVFRGTSYNSFSKGYDLLTQYAISATDLANASQRSCYHDNVASSGTKDIASCATAFLPQIEPAEKLPFTTTDSDQDPEGKAVSSTFDGTNFLAQSNEVMPLVLTKDQTTTPEQQSPWTPLCTVESTLPPLHHIVELGEDVPAHLPGQPVAGLLESPALINDSPAVRPSQQSPWAEETALPNTSTGLEGVMGVETTLTTNIEMPVEFTSPPLLEPENAWAPSSVPLPTSTSPFQIRKDLEDLEPAAEANDSVLNIRGCPNTPTPQIPRPSTPDGEVSIRSFSNFNFSSPQRPSCLPSNSARRSILSNKNPSSVRSSNKSVRRVLFAPLPHEQEDDNYSSPMNLRAASPPPPKLVNLEEESNVEVKYRKHFDIMNRRLSLQGTPTFRYRQRLLPSSSQQKPESPSVDAMAEAFREADVEQMSFTDNVADERKAKEMSPVLEEADEGPQSPWQHDTQGTDDVAAVMGNLDAFLDKWDVNTEIDRIGDTDMLYGAGIW